MLVLRRGVNQPIVIGGNIEVTILDIEEGDRVKIGVDAPSAVSIIRKELLARPRNAPRKNPS